MRGRSAVCSAITHWSESHKTRNHILMSHLRLLQPGGPGSPIYIPQEEGGPDIPPRALGSLYVPLTTRRATVEVL
jgi:hypothetical protein